MWAADVAQAYRQLWTNPLSMPLFGITFEGRCYSDVALSFGCRTSGIACIRVTAAIAGFMSEEGFTCFVYVDDFVGCECTLPRGCQTFDQLL